MRQWLAVAGCILGLAMQAAETNYVAEAMTAFRAGRSADALKLVSAGIVAQPKEARLYNLRAQIHSLSGKPKEAIADLTEAIALEGTSGWLYQERAQLRFKLGDIPAAVSDFDRANEYAPRNAPQNWQRGIALYYADRFADGRKQFELHRSVNPDDVENAAWHFLCAAREQGVEKARAQLIPIQGDTRVPMKQIHELFAGKLTRKEVLAAADAGADAGPVKLQRFYAHLYLALYAEALGQTEQRDEDLRMAVLLADPEGYMGIVARVHADQVAARAAKAAPTQPAK